MPEIPKYNGTTDRNEHVTSYTCAIKGNNLEDDEIESILLKKFVETLSKGAIIWYHNLPPNFIDSFSILVDSFVKAHAEAIKVETRKSDLFKVRQKGNEMLRVEDDLLGALSGFVYPIRPIDRIKREIDREPRSNRDQYEPYNGERRSSESGRNSARNEKRNDQGQSSRGLMSKNGFDGSIGPKEAQLSEYNFNVDTTAIISAIGRIQDTKWPRPLQTHPTQRDPNKICKYHGTRGHRIEECRQLREEVAR
uniref:Uncharacterized protein LOC104250194 n=1 Tax=Nicotiana sylvestris TaxID=4096 RepID=A0A1U7Z115_NICSY|nr:PREDICTED: uncharacterized protein LOC104250194 [Nicotiana sylvestris]